MKIKLEFEGDYYEDTQTIKEITNHHELYMAIWEARSVIRQRLKYGEDVCENEEKILEEIRQLLYVEGFEW